MTIKELIVLTVLLVCILEVFGDGYGHGQSVMVPGGGRGRRKWSIRAKGKGMQNMMKMPMYKKEEKKEEPKVIYYPVPVYKKKEYDEYETKYETKIIPIYEYGKKGGYGGYDKGYDKGYGSYEDHYGKASK